MKQLITLSTKCLDSLCSIPINSPFYGIGHCQSTLVLSGVEYNGSHVTMRGEPLSFWYVDFVKLICNQLRSPIFF
mgnify:FL=1